MGVCGVHVEEGSGSGVISKVTVIVIVEEEVMGLF